MEIQHIPKTVSITGHPKHRPTCTRAQKTEEEATEAKWEKKTQPLREIYDIEKETLLYLTHVPPGRQENIHIQQQRQKQSGANYKRNFRGKYDTQGNLAKIGYVQS